MQRMQPTWLAKNTIGMEKMNDKRFEKFLWSQPLRESSIRKYIYAFRAIPSFSLDDSTDTDKDETIENINAFLSSMARKKNNALYSIVIKKYLMYKRRFDLLPAIASPRFNERKRKSRYLDEDELFSRMHSIEPECYKVASFVQLFGGMRASETLRVQLQHIQTYENYFLIDVLKAKTSSYTAKIVGKAYFLLKDWLEKNPFKPYSFVFCKKGRDGEISIENNYRYYFDAIKNAVNIGTHDLKRNLARILAKKKVPSQQIQQALHHKDFSVTQRCYIGELSFDETPEVFNALSVI